MLDRVNCSLWLPLSLFLDVIDEGAHLRAGWIKHCCVDSVHGGLLLLQQQLPQLVSCGVPEAIVCTVRALSIHSRSRRAPT